MTKANTLEALVKILSISEESTQALEEDAKTSLNKQITEHGQQKFLDNPEWYIDLATEGVVGKWFKERTQIIRKEDDYIDALGSREIQTKLDVLTTRIKVATHEYALSPEIKLRNGAAAAPNLSHGDFDELLQDFGAVFGKIKETLVNLDSRIRHIESENTPSPQTLPDNNGVKEQQK